MHGTKIELNPLPDADWPRTDNHNLFPVGLRTRLILRTIAGIIIGRFRFKLGSAGIYHFINRMDFPFIFGSTDFFHSLSAEFSNCTVKESKIFCLPKKFTGKRPFLQRRFYIDNCRKFSNEPEVNFRNLMYFFGRNAAAESFCADPQTAIINVVQPVNDFIIRQIR